MLSFWGWKKFGSLRCWGSLVERVGHTTNHHLSRMSRSYSLKEVTNLLLVKSLFSTLWIFKFQDPLTFILSFCNMKLEVFFQRIIPFYGRTAQKTSSLPIALCLSFLLEPPIAVPGCIGVRGLWATAAAQPLAVDLLSTMRARSYCWASRCRDDFFVEHFGWPFFPPPKQGPF